MNHQIHDPPTFLEVPGPGVFGDEVEVYVKQYRNPTDRLGPLVGISVLVVRVSTFRCVATSAVERLEHLVSLGEDAVVLSHFSAVVSASKSEASTIEQLLDDLAHSGADERLELVLEDRGTAVTAATRLSNKFNYEVRRVGWDEAPRNEHGAKIFRPIRLAWRVEVAHGHLVQRRRLARCFENAVTSATGWLHVASITEVLQTMC